MGRGCWAGPMVAAAVALAKPIDGLNDSKKLTKAKRESLAKQIHSQAAAVGLGWVSAERIDIIGLSAANQEAMQLALDQIGAPYDRVIVDGSYNYLSHINSTIAVIGADGTVPEVSAASIVAKVARDNYMQQAALKYPKYGFDKHVGYGTKLHSDMLAKHGVCILHRHSFKPIRAIVGNA